ncbi:hypothetical protein GCM10020219_055190 [Nonomuraea dietziae]
MLSVLSHDNADSDGEDADGFAAKLTVGSGNVFRYAVARNNIDDGWDLYTKTDTGAIGAVTIEDSLSYDNGTLSDGGQAGNGDRNGYKLGGEDIGVNHVIRRNIAYNNGKHGFTYNRNPGAMTVSDNISVDNTERNYTFEAGSSVFRNNVSCRAGSGSNDKIVGNADSFQPVLVRHERLSLRLLLRRSELVLRRGRPPRRHLRRHPGHAVTPSGRAPRAPVHRRPGRYDIEPVTQPDGWGATFPIPVAMGRARRRPGRRRGCRDPVGPAGPLLDRGSATRCRPVPATSHATGRPPGRPGP